MRPSREPRMEGAAPCDWTWDLEQRSRLATPQDTVRGLFFTSILESVRLLGGEASLARCQQILENPSFVPLFNYPVSLLLRLTGAAMQELSGHYGSPESAARALGHKATEDFMKSPVGNAVRMMARQDIRLFLGSAQNIHRIATNYGDRSVEWLGPKSGRLIMRRNFMPLQYHEGVLEELLTRYGVKGVRVKGQQMAPLDSEYDFSWE